MRLTGYDCDQVGRLLDQCETTIRILAKALKQISTKPTEEAK